MPRMILLGTGTAVPDMDRENTHMIWDGPGGPLLIDAGGSTYQRLLRSRLDPQGLRGVLLTHSHADHINGLPVLLFSMALAGRTEPLPIYGLPETLELVRGVVDAFHLGEYRVEVVWTPLEAGATLSLSEDAGGWSIRTAMTQHSRPCLALRFENRTSGAALAYSADTSPCQAVQELVHGVQILIHEATQAEPSDTHTTPRQAGEVAAQARVGRLVLVHYSPRWTMPEVQALEEVQAGGFRGTAEIGQEYQILELSESV